MNERLNPANVESEKNRVARDDTDKNAQNSHQIPEGERSGKGDKAVAKVVARQAKLFRQSCRDTELGARPKELTHDGAGRGLVHATHENPWKRPEPFQNCRRLRHRTECAHALRKVLRVVTPVEHDGAIPWLEMIDHERSTLMTELKPVHHGGATSQADTSSVPASVLRERLGSLREVLTELPSALVSVFRRGLETLHHDRVEPGGNLWKVVRRRHDVLAFGDPGNRARVVREPIRQ